VTQDYVLPPTPIVGIPVVGGGVFPVHRIYCVGRNYEAHAQEMGVPVDREAPFFFLKPADATELTGAVLPYPRMTQAYHFEVELVVALGAAGADIPVAEAMRHVFGYAVGLDMTRRDLQLAAREKGRPWDMGKAFDHSAPCGPITRANEIPALAQRAIQLRVNGVARQRSQLNRLIWSVAEIIHWLSRFQDLVPGDLIFTGTPEGVGPVQPGDQLAAAIDGLQPLAVSIAGGV
jgi:fumarylpyruvate hydrolase